MKWFAETTEWSGDTAPNHVYLMDDGKSKMYAYVKFGTGAAHKFRTPVRIDIRGRKFKIVPDQWNVSVDVATPAGETWTVTGSKGEVYTVTRLNNNLSCTCSGFRFRAQCKHTKQNG